MEQEANNVSPQDHPRSKKRAKHRKAKFFLIIGGVCLLLAGALLFYLLPSKQVLSKDIIGSVDFPVYAPNQTPAGYTVEQEKVGIGGNMLSYVLRQDSSDNSVTVTIQPLPKGFDMAQLIDKGSVKSVDLSSGTLYNLSAGGASQYMLETGDALVFMTSSSNIDIATINTLAGSLSKQN